MAFSHYFTQKGWQSTLTNLLCRGRNAWPYISLCVVSNYRVFISQCDSTFWTCLDVHMVVALLVYQTVGIKQDPVKPRVATNQETPTCVVWWNVTMGDDQVLTEGENAYSIKYGALLTSLCFLYFHFASLSLQRIRYFHLAAIQISKTCWRVLQYCPVRQWTTAFAVVLLGNQHETYHWRRLHLSNSHSCTFLKASASYSAVT